MQLIAVINGINPKIPPQNNIFDLRMDVTIDNGTMDSLIMPGLDASKSSLVQQNQIKDWLIGEYGSGLTRADITFYGGPTG